MQFFWLFIGVLILIFAILSVRVAKRDFHSKLLVTSWGDLQENQVLIELINDFRKQNPSCDLQLERISFSEYIHTINKDIERGYGPDVIFVEANNFVDFFYHRSLAPLDPLIQTSGLGLNEFYPAIVDRFTVDGQIYALPRDTAPICMVYYNKSAFDEAGLPYPSDQWDWNSFAETAQKLTKRDSLGKVLRWGVVENWAMTDSWVYNAGGSYVDNPKKPTRWTFTTDPRTRMAIRFRADLIHKYQVTQSPSSTETIEGENTATLFATGRAAMFISGLWKTPYFRQTIQDFSWDAAPMPRSPLGHQGYSSGGSGYAISKASKNKALAWKFIQHITGEAGSSKLAATGLAQPALRKMAESPLFLDGKDPANKKLLIAAVPHGKYSALCANWWEAFYFIVQALDPIWKENRDMDDVLEKIQKHLETIPPQAL